MHMSQNGVNKTMFVISDVDLILFYEFCWKRVVMIESSYYNCTDSLFISSIVLKEVLKV